MYFIHIKMIGHVYLLEVHGRKQKKPTIVNHFYQLSLNTVSHGVEGIEHTPPPVASFTVWTNSLLGPFSFILTFCTQTLKEWSSPSWTVSYHRPLCLLHFLHSSFSQFVQSWQKWQFCIQRI